MFVKKMFSDKFNFKKTFSISNKLNELKVKDILILQKEFNLLSSEELREKFQNLRKKNIEDFSSIVESFAIVREISFRECGYKHFPTQLMGGLVLHQGKIAEMKTGEGKTLVATLPASLNSLSTKGVHIVTVNDYLAKRDAMTMGKIYNALGLTTGLIQQGMSVSERKKNYLADVTYVTNTELGFDYLRDNTASTSFEEVLRPFHFCIVDEVDSILIDEARTPLILGSPTNVSFDRYLQAHVLSSNLIKNKDFSIDEKKRDVVITEEGFSKLENMLNINNLFDWENPWISYFLNALKANYLFEKNKDYVVQKNEVIIVDEFTGRTSPNRRWSGGLHQAIEAKEKVSIQGETQTMASITYQNFFILYPKIAGMSGTAKTAEEEFKQIYDLDVIVLPTAKPLLRKDLPDLVYQNQLLKWKAVAKECKKNYEIGRPILIGTSSIESSEIMSALLKELEIPHQVLNARPENVARESEIIGQAGRKHAITIATNMAGRGTDILLGGNPKILARQQLFYFFNFLIKSKIIKPSGLPLKIFKNFQYASALYNTEMILREIHNKNLSIKQLYNEINLLPETGNSYLKELYNILLEKMKSICKRENEEVKALGGLYVIGTERHESRRIDNQLRGRSGRLGDPGLSQFFLSLDDKLLVLFGGNKITKIMQSLSLEDETPLNSNLLTNTLDKAQSRVESFFYQSRKQMFEYDEVLNFQRQILYKERREILKSISVRDLILHFYEDFIFDIFSTNLKDEEFLQIIFRLQHFLGFQVDYEVLKSFSNEKCYEFFCEQAWVSCELKEAEVEIYGNFKEIQKKTLLFEIDKSWMNHLNEIASLRDSIGWRGYEQRDPLIIYQEEAFQLFSDLIKKIRYNVICSLLNFSIEKKQNEIPISYE